MNKIYLFNHFTHPEKQYYDVEKPFCQFLTFIVLQQYEREILYVQKRIYTCNSIVQITCMLVYNQITYKYMHRLKLQFGSEENLSHPITFSWQKFSDAFQTWLTMSLHIHVHRYIPNSYIRSLFPSMTNLLMDKKLYL